MSAGRLPALSGSPHLTAAVPASTGECSECDRHRVAQLTVKTHATRWLALCLVAESLQVGSVTCFLAAGYPVACAPHVVVGLGRHHQGSSH